MSTTESTTENVHSLNCVEGHESPDGNATARTAFVLGEARRCEPLMTSFPLGTTIDSLKPAGTSSYGGTFRLNVSIPSAETGGAAGEAEANVKRDTRSFFLKLFMLDSGKRMCEGEYMSALILSENLPRNCVKPHGWGLFTHVSLRNAAKSPVLPGDSAREEAGKTVEEEGTYYLLTPYEEFVPSASALHPSAPSPKTLIPILLELHYPSTPGAVRPQLFGFPVQTTQGCVPSYAGPMSASWTTYFTNMLEYIFELDTINNESWPDLYRLYSRAITHLVPRLIAPLEVAPRTIVPSLIHGDIWEGNMGTVVSSGDLHMFDASALYAHAELEVAELWCFQNRIGHAPYRAEYRRRLESGWPGKPDGIDEPKAEWEDRTLLYSVWWHVNYSVCQFILGKPGRQT